ncbi:MAG: hypothetical protein E7354_03955 [Clostridiales bacterium]|nr:hypothetical protein [Clostridiales bacterium]
MTTKKLVLKIISIVLAVVSYISMAFPFVISLISREIDQFQPSVHSSELMSFGTWNKVLEGSGKNLWGWKVSRVIMIILLIVILAMITISIIQFFLNNSSLDKVLKYISISGIVLASLFILFFFIGCILEFGNAEFVSVAVFPHVGSSLLGISALISSILTLKSLNSK